MKVIQRLYAVVSQLPGKLFSPSDNFKKLSRHFLLHFSISIAKEIHPDILRGGHRNPYQLENAIKSGGTVFFLHHLG